MPAQVQNGKDIAATKFMPVRFGHVVGSIGSVAPLFKKQIEKGGAHSPAAAPCYFRILFFNDSGR